MELANKKGYDNMVKIRITGTKLELKEIENRLKNIGLIQENLKRYPNTDNKTFRIYLDSDIEQLLQAMDSPK